MPEPCESIRRACGLFGKVRDADRPHAEQLQGQVAVWDLIRHHFAGAGYAPRLLLVNVDPWPNRPPIQPWLDAHFAGLYRRSGHRIQLDIRVLDRPGAMELLTNVMRFIPITPSGQTAHALPLFQGVVLQLEAVEPGAVVAFLEQFNAGNTWGRALGSLPSERRTAFKRFIEARRGRVLVHPHMGLENHVSVYASPETTLAPVMDRLAALLQTWRDVVRGQAPIQLSAPSGEVP